MESRNLKVNIALEFYEAFPGVGYVKVGDSSNPPHLIPEARYSLHLFDIGNGNGQVIGLRIERQHAEGN